ncbi:MAG TPA: PEP-CTERM sorting domain-containing protein [Casimicrobiaceae bacterium]|nr:PEP-CTERM sorting domain-containing protein [Casimicrobiaceae bacterium]
MAGFATTGADMGGLVVEACFSNQFCETLAWSATGVASGGVDGAGWALNVTGDTFNVNAWSFTFDSPFAQIVTLALRGANTFTIFDRTLPDPGTNGSASGRDFDTAAGGTIDVTYSLPTGIGGNPPVGDLFQNVFIDFNAQGPRTSFLFSQDADNDIRIVNGKIPEPGSLALLAAAALGLSALRRRRS